MYYSSCSLENGQLEKVELEGGTGKWNWKMELENETGKWTWKMKLETEMETEMEMEKDVEMERVVSQILFSTLRSTSDYHMAFVMI